MPSIALLSHEQLDEQMLAKIFFEQFDDCFPLQKRIHSFAGTKDSFRFHGTWMSIGESNTKRDWKYGMLLIRTKYPVRTFTHRDSSFDEMKVNWNELSNEWIVNELGHQRSEWNHSWKSFPLEQIWVSSNNFNRIFYLFLLSCHPRQIIVKLEKNITPFFVLPS